MDSIVFGAATATCKAFSAVGLNQLAIDIGFKGANFLGLPAVYCGPQPSAYKIGVIVLSLVVVGIFSLISNVRKTKIEN